MQNLRRFFYASTLIVAFVFALPFMVNAETTLNSILPATATDISDEISAMPPGDTEMFSFEGVEDEDYVAEFTTDTCPAIVLTLGGSMTVANNWSCDDTTGILTVAVTADGFVEGAGNHVDAGQAMFQIAMTPPTTSNGPSEADIGMWMSTDVQEWQMIPPSPGNIAFGYTLSGPAGEQGFFKMFMPQGTIDMLSFYADETLTPDDLVIFNGDAMASLAVTSVTGGALVDINVTFSNFNNAVSTASQKLVTKTFKAGQQPNISFTAKKTKVKKNKRTKLFGWVKGVGKNKKVTILRGTKTKNLKKWRTVKTNKNGGFSSWIKVKKNMKYKAKAKVNSKTRKSSVVTIKKK